MKLCQFFTPLWVAEALVEKHFPRLDCADLVVEPTCGKGGFLRAVPAGVPALGVDIDPKVADVARRENGRAGFILPTYFFQTASRLARYADQWSVSHELLPRNAFHSRMRTPLTFAVFAKDLRKLLIGFALYREAADLQALAGDYREALSGTEGETWKSACERALRRLGGEACLQAIYAEVEKNKPSRTEFWREGIRRTLRTYTAAFQAVEIGRYALVKPTAGTAT